MAICDDCFEEFVHPLIHEAQEKNRLFEERYGQYVRWDWDDELSTPTFSDPVRPTLEIDVSIVGTTEGSSWQWSWANKNTPQSSKVDIEKVQEFGESQGYDRLTTGFLDADEYTGWEMTAIAVKVLDALGSYRFPTDNGYCYLVYRKIKEIARRESGDLFGAMRGTFAVANGVDLTEPTGEVWDAENESESDPLK
jgi:hypothetical protein